MKQRFSDRRAVVSLLVVAALNSIGQLFAQGPQPAETRAWIIRRLAGSVVLRQCSNGPASLLTTNSFEWKQDCMLQFRQLSVPMCDPPLIFENLFIVHLKGLDPERIDIECE